MSGIKFAEYNSEQVISDLVSKFEEVLGVTLQPSDERRIFLNTLAEVIVGINANINDTGNQVLLRYARGEALDAIGEMLGVERLAAGYAKCVLRFTLSAVQSVSVIIPKGTRATPDGKIYFATDETLIIPAGSLTGEISATSTVSGVENNGFAIGQIKYIVDNTAFLSSVSNITESSGGSDRESDDSLRERIRLVPESFSTAGCTDGYIYWAKSASADIGDVSVYSPVNDTSLTETERENGAGLVYIYILKANGSIPEDDDELINRVYSSVNAKDKRPLTDKVTVLPPTAVNYSIDLSYYISSENEINEADIHQKISEAITEYVSWQGAKIGRDINPDKLRNLILNAGASRVVLNSPTFTQLNNKSVALLNGAIVATYAGVSE